MNMSSDQLSKTMRAWIQSRAGRPSEVLSISEIATPASKDANDEVLVRISHAALNPGGSIVLQLCPFLFRTNPSIAEMDFSGTVVDTATATEPLDQLAKGDRVFGSVDAGKHIQYGLGSLAEYVAVPRSNVVNQPRTNATDAEAAGLGIAGCTALDLIDAASLKKGNSVLVYGASGGIGSMVAQMARDAVGSHGRVVAVCSGRNADVVKDLGADEVIDYQKHHPITKYLAEQYSQRRFDAVIDAYGVYGLYSDCLDFLAEGKPFVSVGVANKAISYSSMLNAVWKMLANVVSSWIPGIPQRRYIQVNSGANQAALERLRSLVEQGKLSVVVDSCWEMEDALKAYERMQSKRARGKVIVHVQSP